jgi:acetyl-CoA C-acetyltransferase
MWPNMFNRVAEEYDRRYGIDETHLRAIAQLNFANARANPNAQTRDWTVPDPLCADDANPPIEGRLRRFDCSRMTDGGAGIVLVTDEYLRDRPNARPVGRIDGWGHRTVGFGLRQKLDRASKSGEADPYLFPHVRGAVLDAFGRAHVRLDGVDGFEVHDCFTPSEYLAIDHIGLTGPEDDGYLVTLTTDMNDDASYCLVFDAARVDDGPVCKLALPERISSGTHSTWAPGLQLRRWHDADSAAASIRL